MSDYMIYLDDLQKYKIQQDRKRKRSEEAEIAKAEAEKAKQETEMQKIISHKNLNSYTYAVLWSIKRMSRMKSVQNAKNKTLWC